MADLMIDPATELSQFQDQFAAFLLHRGDFAGEDAGLRIYRNNVMMSLTRALAAQYPATKSLVGEQFFNALARDYVLAHPPEDPSLTFYGDTLSTFIAQHHACRALAWLPDVARLEFLCQQVLHAADDKSAGLERLVEIEAEQFDDLFLPLPPGAMLMQSRWPVHLIREEALRSDPNQVAMEDGEHYFLLVRREEVTVNVTALPEPQWQFLQHLNRGESLSQAWDKLQQDYILADEALVSLLSQTMRILS
ncbi:MAG: DNA-binding domain-containing protein [Pseudohongiellaceae bacterium]